LAGASPRSDYIADYHQEQEPEPAVAETVRVVCQLSAMFALDRQLARQLQRKVACLAGIT
jgi:hypothetical protein